MFKVIFSNFIYAGIFYFFVFIPLISLVLLPAFRSLQRKISVIERGWLKCYCFAYAIWSLVSLFAASLSYLLLKTNTGSYFFIVHFFVVIPLLCLFFSYVLSRIRNIGSIKDYYSDLSMFLMFFSLFSSLFFMGFKLYSF